MALFFAGRMQERRPALFDQPGALFTDAPQGMPPLVNGTAPAPQSSMSTISSDGPRPRVGGVFGSAMSGGAAAPMPMAGGEAPSLVPDGQAYDLAANMSPAAAAQLATAKVKRPAFGPNGYVTQGMGLLGDAFSGSNAYGSMLERRREMDARQQMQMQQRAWQVEDRDFAANQPDYFNSGRDRIRFDPRTGESSVVYDGPEEFQTYAEQFGEAGTPDYRTAAQDYVLRGNGPTAFGYDSQLEGVRQENRALLEAQKQGNRLQLRQTPTYANLNPRPAAPRSGGGGGSRGPTTMSGVIAPFLAKMARGEQLTPGEQRALETYQRGRGGGGGRRGGAAVGGGGAPVRVTSIAEARALPAGTEFITPDGKRKVR